jgi:uncharacterized damage-inducible protein DinB
LSRQEEVVTLIGQLERLYGHLAWADRLAIGALRSAATPPGQALQIMSHVLGAEEVWLSRLEQRPAAVAVWPVLSVDECARLAEANRKGFAAYLAGLGGEDLDRVVAYVNSAGRAFESKAWDILVHAAMHGSYHRGQVMLLLRSSGHEPAATDYIAYVRGAAAATRR